MKRIVGSIVIFLVAVGGAFAQRGGDTVFTGTAIIYGSGMNLRTVSNTFTLRITGETSPSQAAEYLSVLQRGGQDDLLNGIRNNDLGRFSLGGNVGQRLNAVVVDQVGNRTRVRAVYERWMGIGELRGGYRSTDYPFGYVEITFDPRTGKGDGTFIPAARIRFRDNKNGPDTVEIEDFGTFPGKLMGVSVRGQNRL